MEYAAYLQTPYWHGLTRRLNIRYPRCFVCMKPCRGQGHHVRYDRLGSETIGVDVFKLCDSCHADQHYFMRWFRLPLVGLSDRLRRARFWWSVFHGHLIRAGLTLILPMKYLR